VGGTDGFVSISGHDPVPIDVFVDHGCVAASQPSGGLGFPGVGEAADAGQLGGFGVGGQEAEQPAGFDRAELVVVANQDQFRPGGLDQQHQLRPGRGWRPSTPHHTRRPHYGEVYPALAGVVEESGQSLGWNARLLGQDAGRDRRGGHAPYRDAGRLPGLAGGPKGAGLA
jgi:hypothetical protein